jgi:hypothetical protein
VFGVLVVEGHRPADEIGEPGAVGGLGRDVGEADEGGGQHQDQDAHRGPPGSGMISTDDA